MKKIYWRPRAVSRTALMLISLLSIGGLLVVEYKRVAVDQPYFAEKHEAAELAAKCMQVILQERLDRNHFIDPQVDPGRTGLIGEAMTPATSTSGVLAAKQTSINPNFAAVIVEMLRKAGVQKGDTVAIGYSGSFPALNICTSAAVETLELKPIGISSAAASQWGANVPDFLWIDMEKKLADEKLISFRSVAASLGGVEDRGLGMAEETRETIKQSIRRVDLPLLDADTFDESLENRMALYSKQAGGARIKAYINVGGGTTSVGRSLGKKLLHAGLNTRLPRGAYDIDSVMTRFLKNEVPVIHMVRIADLAKRYGLPIEPKQMPKVGEGQVFRRLEYNKWYAGGVLTLILLSLYAFIRSDWGFRMLQSADRRKDIGHPEPMV